MIDPDLFTKILLILIILHFIVGFGYMIYKLSPKKKDETDKQEGNDSLKMD